MRGKILFFGSNYPPDNAGGAELSAHLNLLDARGMGFDVMAIATRNRYHKKYARTTETETDGIPVTRLYEENGLALQEKIRAIADRFQPDLIYAQSLYANHAFSLKGPWKKVFYLRHQFDIQGKLPGMLAKDGSIRIISNSEWMKSHLQRELGRNSTVVRPAVFPRSCLARQTRRKTIAIGNGVASKGIDKLLRLALLLPDLPFEVFGTLDSSVDPGSLPFNVRHEGWTDDVSKLYENAKVFLNLSVDPEPWGRTLVEAMTNGIPVIAHNEGGPREIVRNGGVLLPTDDDHAAASIIRRMFHDGEYYSSLVEGTRLDIQCYNPFAENAKMTRILALETGKPQYEYLF